jgi:hypothetical protein
MKKITQLLCFTAIAFTLKAQTVHMSTSYKQTCYWNENTKKFDQCGDNVEYASMFTINPDESMFTHVTNDLKSSYYVTKKQYDSDYDEYEYDVTSDVGNKYTFFVDLKNNLLKIMSFKESNPSDSYLILFTLKNSWKD